MQNAELVQYFQCACVCECVYRHRLLFSQYSNDRFARSPSCLLPGNSWGRKTTRTSPLHLSLFLSLLLTYSLTHSFPLYLCTFPSLCLLLSSLCPSSLFSFVFFQPFPPLLIFQRCFLSASLSHISSWDLQLLCCFLSLSCSLLVANLGFFLSFYPDFMNCICSSLGQSFLSLSVFTLYFHLSLSLFSILSS